jgi:glycosyltransferase involved in cell wall biosynthesis
MRRSSATPLKSCANLGGLQGTANSYGLYFIGTELAPELAASGDLNTAELHVFGARQPTQAVARALEHPQIRLRGYVEDIDAELISCPVFLLANNCGHYQAGHTRFLHAWSLQSCIVAHRNNLETMPELAHGENVLLAANAREFADCIRLAAGDRALRERIGQNGYDLFVSRFAPKVVAAQLAAQMAERAGAHGGAAQK